MRFPCLQGGMGRGECPRSIILYLLVALVALASAEITNKATPSPSALNLSDGNLATPTTSPPQDNSDSTNADDSDGDDDDSCGDFNSANDKCSYVQVSCSGVANLIDYLNFRYCEVQDYPVLSYFVIIPWLLVIISLLATTADLFFVPQLELMSTKLKLPQDVAGITLLAFGNGAPDVFTAISGIDGADDFPLVLSELLGASIFISTVVLGAVFIVSDGAVDKVPFFRDITVYIIATVTILCVASDGSVSLGEAISFLAIYIVYVTVVVVHSYYRRRQQGRIEDVESPDAGILSDNFEGYKQLTEDTSQQTPSIPNSWVGLSFKEWESMSALSKCQMIVEYPFTILRYLSIPCFNECWGKNERLLASVSVPFSVMTIFFDGYGVGGLQTTAGSTGVYTWVFLLLASAVVSVAIYLTTNDQTPPKYHLVLTLIGFATTVAWLDMIANECVAVLESLGIMFNISTSILGLTVLAIGNSVGDFVADTAVARAGASRMAVASCFGSPLLNDIVGLGLSLTVTTASSGAVETELNSQVKIAYMFLGLSLLSSTIFIPMNGFRGNRLYSYYLFALYGTFVSISCMNESGILGDTNAAL
eukprot:GFYU01011147.1.p1 GENE.GFYU01011147.1~~GFYU01011147.1.p1  ORF type:complete len:592 (+),score=30.65 GFYU01011147.1:38-1813(+)